MAEQVDPPDDDGGQCIDCPQQAEPGSSYCKDDAWKAKAPRGISDEDLVNRFSFHPATKVETQKAHDRVRGLCLDLAEELNGIVPDGRELSTAITSLEVVMMWANAGIAREGGPKS